MKTYLRHKIVNVIEVKELIALEYLDFEGRYKEYEEQHDFWELCFVEKGEITIRGGAEEQCVVAGEILLIPPNQRHAYLSKTGNDNRVFVVCFECSSQALKSLSGKAFRVSKVQEACLKRLIEESVQTFYMDENGLLATASSPNFGGQQAILIHLEYLLICWIRQLSLEDNFGVVFLRNEKFYVDIAEIIIEYFQQNISKKLSLDDICEKVNYSKAFLCRIFKAQTGETLLSCFNRLKIEEAKRLLKETELSVETISQELGFLESKYFSAVFKRLTGVSPTVYKSQFLNRKNGVK